MSLRYECIKHDGGDYMYESDTGNWRKNDDYMALIRGIAAERDAYNARIEELERRLAAVIKSLEPGECRDWLGGYWLQKHYLHKAAKAIAEGRDNG